VTESQKKWVAGGSIGAGALFVGYLLFRGSRRFLPGGHDVHEHHKKHHRSEGENARGEYGRKKKHHHGDHRHG
jgi:hypothetical protein